MAGFIDSSGSNALFSAPVGVAIAQSSSTVYVADSFMGLPPPDPARYPADAGLNLHKVPFLAISLDEVKENFSRYGLLDGQVVFVEGWFRDTLPHLPAQQLAVLRLDGDLYESTYDALEALHHRVSPGGFVIIDDYGEIPACRAAVTDFRERNGIDDPIIPIDDSGVYWRRAAR
jgi:O-methyltransferase